MEIVLGIYDTTAWEELVSKRNFHWEFYPFKIKHHDKLFIIEVVHAAIIKADVINFILDGISLPLDVIKSCSCHELSIILNCQEFVDKTIFWLNSKKISTNDLLEKIKQSREQKIKL